jgi:4-amino-4-deoxy-L-arabinose transferase-like glycosyltransferase
MRPFVTACVLAVGALCLSAPQVGTMPPSLSEDEVTIALTAQSIATSGKDLVGRSWPLYIQITDGSWYHPVIVYSIALVLQVLPLSEFAIRLPTLCAGVANVVLMYFLARVLFRREAAAILAAVLLALTPTHFLHSRVAHEYLYPVPFILAWLLCLFSYLERDDPRWLFAGTAALGVGFYSYIGSVLVMPMYLMLTGLVLLLRHQPAGAGGIALAGFLLPVLPLFVPWLVMHQPAFSNTVGHYLIYDTSRLNPLQGLRELLSYSSIAARTTIYWGFFNPSFLFLDLTAPLISSTRTTGVFLLPLGFFVVVALWQAFRSAELKSVVLVLGFLTAPLAAVLIGEAGSIGRALAVLPFGVLLASSGVVHLWAGPRLERRRVLCLSSSAAGLAVGVGYAAWTLLTRGQISATTPLVILVSVGLGIAALVSDRTAWRMAVVVLLATGLVQFQQYWNDYFTDYRSRVSEAVLLNRRDALEYVIDRSGRDNVPAIYLSGLDRDVGMAEQFWKFYLIKHRREDLASRTVIQGESLTVDLAAVPPKSAILARVGDPTTESLAAAGELTLETLITEPSGRPSFAVFRR